MKNRLNENNWFIKLLPLITIVVFLVAWQLAVNLKLVDQGKLASPVDIWNAFLFKLNNTGPDGSTLIKNILASLQVSISGLLLGIVIGVPLGLLMGWYKLFDRFVNPIFEIVRPIPPVAWIPLLIIWVGLNLKAKALIIFVTTFVPCVINSYTGVHMTPQVLINVYKTFGASNFYIFTHVAISSSIPMIFAGMRLALGLSWSTLVAAEMLSASAGLGYMMNMARNYGRIDIVLLAMLIIGLIGYLMTLLFGVLERKIVKGRTVL